MREFVSRCRHPGKIQWIHTDYAAWRELNEWTRAVTKNDAALYRRFDAIVCLNRTLREKFLAVYPQFADKTLAVPNPVFRGEIRERAKAPLTVPVDERVCNLITIGRLEREKRYDRLLDIAAELKKCGFAFRWYFAGSGRCSRYPAAARRARSRPVRDADRIYGKPVSPARAVQCARALFGV